jgi:hypothetical protein
MVTIWITPFRHEARPYTDCVGAPFDLPRAIMRAAHCHPTPSDMRLIAVQQQENRALAASQDAIAARFARIWTRCSKRERLIGVRFSDSSRDLTRGSRTNPIRKPRESSRICQG